MSPTLNPLPSNTPETRNCLTSALGALAEKPAKLVQNPDSAKTSTLEVGLTWGFKSSRFHPAVTDGSG